MRAIYTMDTVLIELTNACVYQCSNCTRFCGHHQKPFFMDWETYKRAVDASLGFTGVIGIMGGEPTLHPNFDAYTEYLSRQRPEQYPLGAGILPLSDFHEYTAQAGALYNGVSKKCHGIALWTTVCESYYRHYERIQDVFTLQAVNDLKQDSRHQAILMSRREFGIPDDRWEQLRDACWWQTDMGSPCITPKGAFFCEIAGALDMLFDGPGGWPIEPGWWKRGPEDFGDQLHLCELCAMPFTTLDRNATEEIDDVSPALYEKLKQLGSPKVKKGRVCIHTGANHAQEIFTPREGSFEFLGEGLQRQASNSTLYPKRIVCCVCVPAVSAIDEESLRNNKALFDRLYVLTADPAVNAALHDRYDVVFRADASAGTLLVSALYREKDWVVLQEAGQQTDPALREILRRMVFNPGTFHHFAHNGMRMFNVLAKAWRSAGYDGVARLTTLEALPTLWEPRKVVTLTEGFEDAVIPDLQSWRQQILHYAPRDHGATWDRYTMIAAKHEAGPVLDAWREAAGSIGEKLIELDALRFTLTPPEGVLNKLRTAIHTLLAHEIGPSPEGVAAVREALSGAAQSFCAQYALAMLSAGAQKEEHLARCLLHPQNQYHLGLTTLKLHYESENPVLHQQPGPRSGMIEELIALACGKKPVIILGNRYAALSIAMILSAANLPPLAFGDDTRTYISFMGIPTRFLSELSQKHGDHPVLISAIGAEGSALYDNLRDKAFSGGVLVPHRLTLLEMNKTPVALAEIPRYESNPGFYFASNVIISESVMQRIGQLRRCGTYALEELRALLR